MFKTCFKAIIIALLLNCARGLQVTPFQTGLNCQLSCSNDITNVAANNEIQGRQGPPGKKGPEGPIGPEGPPGQKGDSCECPNFNEFMNEFNKLKEKLGILLTKDCSGELVRLEGTGKQTIYPSSDRTGLKVYCDQDTDGGGWTVIQRRVDDSIDFYRNWTEYQRGFGDLDTNFWLGLDNIYELLRAGAHEVRFDMEDFDNNTAHAQYSQFTVGPSSSNYRMTINGYSGDAADGMRFHNGQQFSTFDADHDTQIINCAERYKGGWWYKNCYTVNPNGLYLGPNGRSDTGNKWNDWRGDESLKGMEIKIRKTSN